MKLTKLKMKRRVQKKRSYFFLIIADNDDQITFFFAFVVETNIIHTYIQSKKKIS